jgi:hypothetical protein
MKLKTTLLILGVMVIGGSRIYASAPEQKQPLMCPTADSVKSAVFTSHSYAEFKSKEFTVERQTFFVEETLYNESGKGSKNLTEPETWQDVDKTVRLDPNPHVEKMFNGIRCRYDFTLDPMLFVVLLRKKP